MSKQYARTFQAPNEKFDQQRQRRGYPMQVDMCDDGDEGHHSGEDPSQLHEWYTQGTPSRRLSDKYVENKK